MEHNYYYNSLNYGFNRKFILLKMIKLWGFYMKYKYYLLLMVTVILLFSAGIYAISNDINLLSTNDAQNNEVSKNTVSDLGKNTTTDNSVNSDSSSNIVVKDIGFNTVPYEIVNEGSAIYRPSSIPFTDDDIGVVYVDDNGELYMYGGDRDTTYWGKPGEPDVFNPELNVLTENDIPSPPKIVGTKEYYSMDRLSPEQIDQYNSGAYDSYSDETGNIYVAVDNVVD